MRKMLTFALLGGAVGAGVAIAKASSTSDIPVESDGTAAKAVGISAAIGALMGLVLDRRGKRKARRTTNSARVVAAVSGAVKAAKPKLEHALEATREVALSATEAAQTRLSKAA